MKIINLILLLTFFYFCFFALLALFKPLFKKLICSVNSVRSYIKMNSKDLLQSLVKLLDILNEFSCY